MPYVYCSNNQEELEEFLNLVAESILQNNISLFLGTGSSMQYEAPSWNGLINEICPKFKHSSNIDRAQYAELQGIEVKDVLFSTSHALMADYILFIYFSRHTLLHKDAG